MSTFAHLMALESRLAAGSGTVYDELLDDGALVIVPGAVLDKAACVRAMNESPGWDMFQITDEHFVETQSTVTVVYRFTGRRGADVYAATLASTYVPSNAGWRLALHQQTPDPQG
ncbi:MAG: nuclear transport factor 2 family protein [Cellulomonadaceae bacterium]